MKGLLIDPLARVQNEIDFDPNDWRSMQRLVGGTFDYFVLRDGEGKPLGLVYCADEARNVAQPRVFAFPAAAVLERNALHYNWPIIGTGVLVGFDGKATSNYIPEVGARVGSISFVADAAEARSSAAYRSVTAKGVNYLADNLHERQQAGMVKEITTSKDPLSTLAKMLGGERGNGMARAWAASTGLDPNQTYVKHIGGREARDFIPRPVGTFSSSRCSVAELEAAFLGCYEWARKDSTFHRSPLARAFDAPPFFFPDGLEPSAEEFKAGLAVEDETLVLPFPFDAFWIVRWDAWLSGSGGGGEGPAMLYVEGSHLGFTCRDIYFEKGRGYVVGEPEHHARLGQLPLALVYALHRINNRRHIIDRNCSTPELERVNAGRAKSKHALAPLPGFIRVTGQARISQHKPVGDASERCRHDRRGHWRKRRNGVELPPEEWVSVRPSTIHPEKPASPQKPYMVL